MTFLQAVVLGVVQGATEFLPISSTAHLRVVPAFLGWEDPGAAFTAVLQLGTLVAVVGFFLPDCWRMARAAWRWVFSPAAERPSRFRDEEFQRFLQITLGTIPIGLLGILLKDLVENEFRSLWVIAVALAVVGVALLWVERKAKHQRSLADITLRDALIIGAAQALALVPGVSRSGITLLAAMAVGLKRDAAARFSFLLSVPAVLAAGMFELPEVLKGGKIGNGALLGGLVISAITGYASIAWLLRHLRTRTTLPFVVYRVALAVVLVLFFV